MQQSVDSAISPSFSQMAVIGPLEMRLRLLYRLLAAEGGVHERPYFRVAIPAVRRGKAPSVHAHSSCALLLLVGEVHSPSDCACSELALWKRGSVHLRISVADIRKLDSERLPFLRSRALKLSLLVDERRRLRWMELVWRGNEVKLGQEPVGVTGGEGRMLRQRSSSESPRPRTFFFDLWINRQQDRFSDKPLAWLLHDLLLMLLIPWV